MQRVGGEDRGVSLRRISPAAGACFVLLIVALTWAAPIADLTAPLAAYRVRK